MTAVLWGFDGELLGNEDRLQVRLPLVQVEGTDEIYIARSANWRVRDPRTDVRRLSEDEALQFATKVEMGRRLRLVETQLIVVFGPVFTRVAAELNIQLPPRLFMQGGFSVSAMTHAEYISGARRIAHEARDLFDAEIRAGFSQQRASAALVLYRGTGIAERRAEAVRAIAAAWKLRDADLFRRTVRLAAVRCGISPDELKRDVFEYLGVIAQEPALVLEPIAERIEPTGSSASETAIWQFSIQEIRPREANFAFGSYVVEKYYRSDVAEKSHSSRSGRTKVTLPLDDVYPSRSERYDTN